MSKVIELKEKNLKDVIGEGVALVELGSVTCGPCKMLEPIKLSYCKSGSI